MSASTAPGRSYRRDLRRLLEGSRRQLGSALLLSTLSAVLDLASMVLLPAFVSLALSGGSGQAMPVLSGFGDSVNELAIVVLALFSARVLLSMLLGGYLAHLAQSVRATVANRLMAAALTSPYEEAFQRSSASAVTAVTSHANHFGSHVVLPLLRLAVDAMTIITLLGFLAWVAPKLTAIVALGLALILLTYARVVRRSSEKHSARVVRLEGALVEQASRALHGEREVRVFGLQSFFLAELRGVLDGLAHAQARLGAIYWFPRALGEFLLILMAAGYMIVMTARGHTEMVVLSNLSALAFAGLRLLPAFAQCMVGISALRAGRAVTSQLVQELDAGRPASSVAPSAPIPAVAAEPFRTLELRGLCFGYTPERPIFDGITLTIGQGQSIGVMGRSGAGKSTLGDLILGLLQPLDGQTLVNGQPVSLSQPWWRERVGFVPQNPYIANDSLARNVAFGVPDAEIDTQRLQDALRLAQLDTLVQQWPDGIQTILGERGLRLSGGQRQRVAIARALYRQRELLVLDEATSALDTATESEVINALKVLHGRVTTLVIAHRLTTLAGCDAVIEIGDGKISMRETSGLS